jgi:hypothetical protein
LKIKMFWGSGSWRHLENRFHGLVAGVEDLRAIPDDERQKEWVLSGGPSSDRERDLLYQHFRDLGREAGIASGVSNRESALNGWLNLLREESPHYKRFGEGGVIQSLCLASAEQCEAFAIQSCELEIAAQSGDRPGLRRDRYRAISWLEDDAESSADSNEELNRRRLQAWKSYGARIEEYRQIIENQMKRELPVWPGREENLSEAAIGLAYDLALLLANNLLDRRLHGGDLETEFREETEKLNGQISETWRQNREQLALPVSNGQLRFPDFSRCFDRVGTDLKHLDELLPTAPTEEIPVREPKRTHETVQDLNQDYGPPTKAQMTAWHKISRRRTGRTAALELAVAPRLAAVAELRKASASAVQGAWPQDIEQLAHVLWPSLSKCAETVMDAVAGAKLKSLGSNFSQRRYGRWLRYTCTYAVLEDVCSGNALWDNAKHIHDTIGETLWQPAHKTRRVLARLMQEFLGGPHIDSLQNRVCAALSARTSHWEAAAIEKQVSLTELHPPGSVDLSSNGAMRSEVPKLDVARIKKFIKDEGTTIKS